MPPPPPNPRAYLSQVSFVERSSAAFRTLRGFDKSRHTVPDAVNSATQGFLAKLCVDELSEEAEKLFQDARQAMGYKRKEISLDVTSPSAVLSTRDFTHEIHYALEDADPATYAVTRSLHGMRSAGVIDLEPFDRLFDGAFSTLRFALEKGVRVEAVIDAIESLDEDTHLRVDYPSDCSECTLAVEGVDAVVMCDGASLEMRFSRRGSPAALVRAFEQVRSAFSLSKDRTLSGLLG